MDIVSCKRTVVIRVDNGLQLEVGNGDLTYEESKTHFTVWSFMKSPLLIVSVPFIGVNLLSFFRCRGPMLV